MSPTPTPMPRSLKSYAPPAVVRYGDVEEITKSKQSCNSSDLFGSDARGTDRGGDGDTDWLWCGLS